MVGQDREALKGTLGRIVALSTHCQGMTENAIADLETRNVFADRDDVTRQILAEDEWVFDKRKEHGADGLLRPINRIDRHRVVLDDDSLSRGGVYGADLTSSLAWLATNQAAALEGIWAHPF